MLAILSELSFGTVQHSTYGGGNPPTAVLELLRALVMCAVEVQNSFILLPDASLLSLIAMHHSRNSMFLPRTLFLQMTSSLIGISCNLSDALLFCMRNYI